MRPTIVFVGGFLGAGKTTLILAAARELTKLDKRCAAILNDQSDALVDTHLAALHGVPSGEVVEGCFCCRLSDLTDQFDEMLAHAPDVIFAEPVGSCTDIAATVLHPLRELQDTYRLAPFTVLVDPERADALQRDDADPHLLFLFRKQVTEADLVCVTKADLHPERSDLTGFGVKALQVRELSAQTGEGVAAWLDEVLAGELSPHKDVLDIDYERYAQAEAALAWLNFHAEFEPPAPMTPAMVLGPLLDRIDAALSAANITIVHLKAMAEAPTGYVKAAICANGQEPSVEGVLDASPATHHEIKLNLRALAEPARMQRLLEEELSRMDGRFIHQTLRCFRPAAPQPERRILREQIAPARS